MIATLEGTISEHLGSRIVLTVNGIGYGVLVTASEFGGLPAGKKTKLYIYEHIKEDAHDLYGFTNLNAKQLFEQLLSVKNVGPKAAMAILDIGMISEVQLAIAGGDVKRLQSAKGVGKRASEQVIVELRDKVGVPVGEAAEQLIGRAGVNAEDEALQGLVALGYSEYDAQNALAKVDPKLSTEERIKKALKG